MTTADLISGLEIRGYKTTIVPIKRLKDLQGEIDRFHQSGLLDEEFFEESLRLFHFDPPVGMPEARSLVVIAVPRQQFRIVFNWRGEAIPLTVPSYYLRWRETERQLMEALRQLASPDGPRFAMATLPVKFLAVCSGLADYGRNNICYVPGMGSYNRLWVFHSDMICHDDTWHDVRMMDACQVCSACGRGCPTGAITEERFLLHAERCITFHNERPASVPFPNWIDPSWHNSLIGCSHCQNRCPANGEFANKVEQVAEFSEEETVLILEGRPLDELPSATRDTLQRIDLADYMELLSRNLSVLLHEPAVS